MSYDFLRSFDDDFVDASAPPPLVPTHVPFVDRLLGGGQLPTGVYGLLGPIGSCKTSTGVMLAVEAARRLHGQEADAGRSIAVMLTYEQPAGELQDRALSYATGIPTNAFRGRTSADVLKQHNITRQQIEFLGNLKFISYDEADDGTQQCLRDGIDGIGRLVRQICESKKCDVGLFVVDYVGAIAAVRNAPLHETSEIVASAGRDARECLARPFGCPVWLIHQLHGEANAGAKHGFLAHAGQADGSRKFWGSLDGTIILGEPDPDYRLTVQYFQNFSRRDACFAQFRGDICLLENAGDRQVIERFAAKKKDQKRHCDTWTNQLDGDLFD